MHVGLARQYEFLPQAWWHEIVSCALPGSYDGDLVKALLSTRRVFTAVILLGLMGMAARNVVDPDIWWHLKTGEHIATHREVPHTDPFSYTRAGQPWIAHEWLSELAIFAIYRTAGWGGLIVIFAAVVSFSFFLLLLRCAADPYTSGILTLLGAWATAPLWGVRPQMLSLLLTSVWLLILERSERNRNVIWWTLPLMVLWVNLHAGFGLGIALLALFLLGALIECMNVGPEHGKTSTLRVRTLATVLLLNLLIVPWNPNGFKMYSYPLQTLRSAAMRNYIVEWASPNFHHADYYLLLLLLLAAFAVLAWSRARMRAGKIVLLLVSTFAALSSIRMIPFFVLIVVPIIASALKSNPNVGGHVSPRRHLRAAPFVNAVILFLLTGFVGLHFAQVIRLQALAEAQRFPTRAVAFLNAYPGANPIFNNYDWGGYLIWKLYPRVSVFIDGRSDLYGEHLFHQFADTYQFTGDWQSTLDQWRVFTVIVPSDSPLAAGLSSASGWSIIYRDSQALIFSAHR
jgi:hypothetical protein